MSCTAAQTEGALYSTLATDADLAELVELFVAEMPQRIGQLRGDFQGQNWEHLGRTAHQLKGAAGSYGFHQLTPVAAELESAVRAKAPVAEVEQCLEQLTALCRCLRSGVPE